MAASQAWFQADGDHGHSALCDAVQAIDRAHGAQRRDMNVHHLRLYADRDLDGAVSARSWQVSSGSLAERARAIRSRRPRLSINVVRSMVDAATSMLSRPRPTPTFLTTGSDWKTSRKAIRQSQFLEGLYNAERTYPTVARMVQHGCIFGTGAIKIVRDYEAKRARHEIAYIGELVVDEAEAVNGRPRSLYQVRGVDREVLRSIYGGKRGAKGAEEAIERAKPVGGWPRRADAQQQVMVVEAWHLRSGEGADDGVYRVATDAGVLYSGEYHYDEFPFVTWRWQEDPLGWYGTGIPSELTGIQFEINETIRNIQANWWSGGNLKILVERGSKVIKAALSNDLRGIIVEYTGTPPQWITTQAVAPGLVQYLELLLARAYNVVGISELNAQSQTPFASMSGKARLVHENAESQRFLPAQRRLEQAVGVDLAHRTLEACQDIREQAGDFDVLYPDRKFLRPVKFSEIAAKEGSYEIQCFPTSILPSTPAGKLAMVEQLEARQYINRSQAIRMLDFPDIKRELDVDEAPIDNLDERVARMLDGETVGTEGPVYPPSPEMPFQESLQRIVKWILYAENNGAPDEILSELRKYRDMILALAPPAPPQEPAPSMSGAPPAMPPAAPPMAPGGP